MIPLAEAQRRVLAAVDRLHPRAVLLDDALGLVTSIALTAEEDVPPFANTAMDGFAVQAADTADPPARLKIVGTLPAGVDPAGLSVGPGEAIRIMTGAPIPDGADAVVMVERTTVEGEIVVIDVAVPVGNHVRPAAEDLIAGDEVFAAFTVIRPGHLGVLASLGMRKVPVFPRPRVGILSTGDELIEGPATLRPGQIRDANRPSLTALVRRAGAEAIDLGLVGDDLDEVRAAITAALARCDALITSGGVSMGDFDPVKVVLAELAGSQAPDTSPAPDASMQVAIKPAKPLGFAVVDERPVFGLPGNPASAMVSFELFARPALRKMMGHPNPLLSTVPAVADEALERVVDGKTHFVRVSATWGEDGRLHVRSAGSQGSNLLRSMALADALAALPDGEGVAAGEPVEVLLLESVT